MEPSDAAAGQHLDRVNLPDVGLQVQCARVVRLMHADCCRVVVDGDVHRAAEAHFQAC
ncbi:hypothetical protein D3C85_1827290 [compost metagenome]